MSIPTQGRTTPNSDEVLGLKNANFSKGNLYESKLEFPDLADRRLISNENPL